MIKKFSGINNYRDWAEALDYLADLYNNGTEQEVIDAANLLKAYKNHMEELDSPGYEDEIREKVSESNSMPE